MDISQDEVQLNVVLLAEADLLDDMEGLDLSEDDDDIEETC